MKIVRSQAQSDSSSLVPEIGRWARELGFSQIGVAGVEAGLSYVEAIGSVGTVSVDERFIALTGVDATGNVGTVVFSKEAELTGVEAQGFVGNENVNPITVALSGVSASGAVDTLGVLHENALVLQSGWGSGTWGEYGWGEGAPDTMLIGGSVGSVVPSNAAALTGVEARGFVGTFGVIHINGVSGVSALGFVGNVANYFWTTIDDNQIPDWHNINDSDTANWALIETEDA